MAEIGEPLRRRVVIPQTVPGEAPYVDPPERPVAPVKEPATPETVPV